MQTWIFLLIKEAFIKKKSNKAHKQHHKSVNVHPHNVVTSHHCGHLEMNTSVARGNRISQRVNKKVYHMQIFISIIPIMIACGILMRFLCLSMFALREYIKRPPSTRSTMRNKWQNLFACVALLVRHICATISFFFLLLRQASFLKVTCCVKQIFYL